VHGPGMAGTCSDSSASEGGPTACAALGTCSDASKTSEETCGQCSEPSGTSKKGCETVKGTWTAATWTSANAKWNEPDDPWTGDFHIGTIVKKYVATHGKEYKCHDIDPTDHQAKCTGSDAKCEAAFTGKDESEQVAANCPEGCTFARAPRPAKVQQIHEGLREQPGYSKYMSGCCRGVDDKGETIKIDGKYSKIAGKDGGVATQEECAAACNAEDAREGAKCLGYCHGNPWCVIYGPGIHSNVKDDDPWSAGYYYHEGPIATSKPNPQYICAVKDSDSASSTAAQIPESPAPDGDDSEDPVKTASASVHRHPASSILLGALISTRIAALHV